MSSLSLNDRNYLSYSILSKVEPTKVTRFTLKLSSVKYSYFVQSVKERFGRPDPGYEEVGDDHQVEDGQLHHGRWAGHDGRNGPN